MNEMQNHIQSVKEFVIGARHTLHAIPETAFEEVRTGAYVADALREMGLEVTTGVAGTGVVGLLDTGRPGPCLMIRADMDALPIQEETGLPFASTNPGVMHACGHDSHMSMALGAAKLLSGPLRSDICGKVKFVFQPAEEYPGGAKPMIEQGVLENPKVDRCIGAHIWPSVPEGGIALGAGPVMASMSRFDLTVRGRGGHGAQPHKTVDALEVGAQVVSALQRIVSRQANPLSPTVVTVGKFESGTAFNIIPETAAMCGTMRTFDRDIWAAWEERLDRVIGGVCASMGAEYELEVTTGYPPTVNDPEMTALARACAEQTVGAANVFDPEPSMGGEDMSFFLEKVPGCFAFIGSGVEGGAPIHNPKFNFNDEVMLNGVELFCRYALAVLK